MRTDEERSQQLRDAINPRVRATDPIVAFHLKLAREGSALDIARQVFVDRETMRPVMVPARLGFSAPEVLKAWRNGAEIPAKPENLRVEFADWLENATMRQAALSENERRLRVTMDAQLKLAISDQDFDQRQGKAFARWHLEHWAVADVPPYAEMGRDQPFEKQLTAAVQRHANKMGNR